MPGEVTAACSVVSFPEGKIAVATANLPRILCDTENKICFVIATEQFIAPISFHMVCQSRSIYSMVSWLIISSMALIELLIKCEGALQIHSGS